MNLNKTKVNMKDYFTTAMGFSGDFSSQSFFKHILSEIDSNKKQREKDYLGVSQVDDLEGSEKLNIPYKYFSIEKISNYLHALLDGTTDVYDLTGKFLFNAKDFQDKKNGMFLVGKIDENNKDKHARPMYALYNQEKQLTNYIFRSLMDNLNTEGFCVVGNASDNGYVVINQNGDIKFTSEKTYHHPYVYGVLCVCDKTRFNLLTGERICRENYQNSLSITGFKFVQVNDNSIYKISTTTGEYTIYGEPEKYEAPKPIEPKAVSLKKGTEPNKRVQGRNELCMCGSVSSSGIRLKFKNCCGKLNK